MGAVDRGPRRDLVAMAVLFWDGAPAHGEFDFGECARAFDESEWDAEDIFHELFIYGRCV